MSAPELALTDLAEPDRGSLPAPVEIEYPEESDPSMPDSGIQFDPIHYGVGALRAYYAEREDVSVNGNMFMYFREGDPKSVVAPDVFVAFGAAEKRVLGTYKVWEQGVMPSFVMEVVSPSTHRYDVREKKALYARLGVEELWLYDPRGWYLAPALQGFVLREGEYEPVEGVEEEAGVLRGRSGVLGLELCVPEDGEFRFFDPERGRYLRSLVESEAVIGESETALAESEAALEESEAALEESVAALEKSEAARKATEANREVEQEARRQAEAALEESEANREVEQEARRQAEAALEESVADREAEQEARRQAEAALEESVADREAEQEARRQAEAERDATQAALDESERARQAAEARVAEVEARLRALSGMALAPKDSS